MPDVFYDSNSFSFVWDSDKNEANFKKHGITFQTAAMVFDDELRLELPDPGHSGDEERYITIGLVHKVLTVVYCDRENKLTGHTDIRIISARVATKTEQMMDNNDLRGRY